jgi:hypothetical protein
MGSLESILGLLKSLKIWALDNTKPCSSSLVWDCVAKFIQNRLQLWNLQKNHKFDTVKKTNYTIFYEICILIGKKKVRII